MSEAEHEYQTESMRLVARLTMDAAKNLSLQNQLMACAGLSHLLRHQCPREADAASLMADHLRRAEAAQSVMRDLLS